MSLPAMKSLAASTQLRPSVRLLEQARASNDSDVTETLLSINISLYDIQRDISSNWPGLQLQKKVRISDMVTSPSVRKFEKKFHWKEKGAKIRAIK